MESDLSGTYFMKYIFLILSVVFALLAAVSWFAPELVSFNGAPIVFGLPELILLGFVIVIFFLVHLLISDLFVQVNLDHQRIKFTRKGKHEEYTWNEVESIRQVPSVSPPLYKLKFKDESGYLLFITKRSHIQFGWAVTDLSEMGEFIKEKKIHFGI